MDASSSTAPPRRRFSLLIGPWHASSRVVTVLVLLFLVFCNLAGQEVERFRFGNMPPIVADTNLEYRLEHGWPWTFIARAPLDPFDPGLTVGTCFRFWSEVDEFLPAALAANAAAAILLAGAIGMGFEAWRRARQRLLQVHLRDLLGVLVVASAAGAWYLNQRQEYVAQDKILDREYPWKGTPLDCTYQNGGVTWLRILAGDRRFEFLDRPLMLTVSERDGWPQLARFKSVRSVDATVGGSTAELRHLADLPRLQALSLDELDPFRRSPDRTIELPALPRLRGLQLRYRDGTWRGIDRAPALEVVSLAHWKVDDQTFAELSRLPELRELSLNDVQVTADRLLALVSLPKLRALALENASLDASGLRAIGRFQNLTYLELWGCSLAEGELKQVASLAKLQTLRLPRTNVASQDLATLVGLPLKELYLGGTQVDSQAIPHLLQLSDLRELVVPYQDFSISEQKLLRERLPQCQIHFD